jgi:ribosome biogenesis GTPase
VGNSLENSNIEELREIIKDKVSIVTGQSGAGKSTLLNSFNKSLNLKTGEFSSSLGRGKHTTREVEFLQIYDGLVADTPGFSSMELYIEPERLAYIYPGFNEGLNCKFRGCLHESEPGCKIKEAVDANLILKESLDYVRTLSGEVEGFKEQAASFRASVQKMSQDLLDIIDNSEVYYLLNEGKPSIEAKEESQKN